MQQHPILKHLESVAKLAVCEFFITSSSCASILFINLSPTFMNRSPPWPTLGCTHPTQVIIINSIISVLFISPWACVTTCQYSHGITNGIPQPHPLISIKLDSIIHIIFIKIPKLENKIIAVEDKGKRAGLGVPPSIISLQAQLEIEARPTQQWAINRAVGHISNQSRNVFGSQQFHFFLQLALVTWGIDNAMFIIPIIIIIISSIINFPMFAVIGAKSSTCFSKDEKMCNFSDFQPT